MARGCGPLTGSYDDALAWVASLHRSQLRKGTSVAYLTHLMSVSALVLEDGGTEEEGIAALLHDAVEDCGVTFDDIAARFGSVVASVVLECTDSATPPGVAKAPWIARKQPYVAHLAAGSLSAVRVSGADKTHNARSIVLDIAVDGRWPTFNACPHQSLWYYEEISRVVSSRLPGSRTALQLNSLVSELFASVPGASRSSVARSAPLLCSCSVGGVV